MRIDLIVTRHPGLIEYLKEIGMADDSTKAIEHASPEDIKGLNVCGVLPHSLSCLCKSFTEVPIFIPQELRGEELNIEQVKQYAQPAVTYQITKCS